MKLDLRKLKEEFISLKKENGFKVIDSHIHPYDVMGVIPTYQHKLVQADEFVEPLKPGLLELFQYGNIVSLLSKPIYSIAPSFIHSEIRKMFKKNSSERLLSEMDSSLIDECILVPIEPWSKTTDIVRDFKNNRFKYLASLDIHSIKIDEIHNKLSFYKKELGVVGVKLHPNLQSFKPQPKDNDKITETKLIKIIDSMNELGLFLLIHAGSSFYTSKIDRSYDGALRSKTNGLLKNFIDQSNKSDLFERCSIPIVIAHLGNFGLLRKDFLNVKNIVKTYNNVYFDTSGASPHNLEKVMKLIGYDKLIFGSDSIYNRMIYNLIFVYLSIKNTSSQKDFEKNLSNVFSGNINSIMKA